MSLNKKNWDRLANHIRSQLVSFFDPAVIFAEDENLAADLQMDHKGFYVGISGSAGKALTRQGFMKEGLVNLKDSADAVVRNLWNDLKEQDVQVSQIHTSSFNFVVINTVTYIPDPLNWDQESDGVYFMWGQDHRALYLPYQIKTMNKKKVDVMDRLCCWEAGLCSNLWKTPEGLIFRLSCQSYSA